MTRLLAAVILLALMVTPAQANDTAIGPLSTNLTWRARVGFGDVQQYHLTVATDSTQHGVYAVWLLDDAINLQSIESTVPCQAVGKSILCYADTLTDTLTVDVHGVVVGRAQDDIYTTVGIGDRNFEQRRLMAWSQYIGSGGTVPMVIPTRSEPPIERSVLIPDVRN